MSSERIRVLQIVQHAALGGATLMAMLLARGLDPERYEVSLATGPQTGPEGSLLEEMRAQGNPVHIIPDLVRSPHPLKDPRAVGQLRALLRSLAPQVVNTHGSKPKLLAPWAFAGLPVPVRVAHISGWEWQPARNALEQALFVAGSRLRAGDYDCLVAISEAIRQQGLARRVGRPEQYVVIHSFADVKAFVPATPQQKLARRAELGLPPEAFVAVSVTRLAPQKAPADLVVAMGHVVRHLPQAHLLVVGDGPLRQQTVAQIQALGLGEHVHLLGARRDVPALLQAADIFTLSSHWEALGMVYLEAAAAGLPSAGTAVDGAVEAVEDGVTGLMTPPRQPQLLAESILKLASDPQLRKRMGQAGVQHAQRFSEENYCRNVSDLYERLLRQKGAA